MVTAMCVIHADMADYAKHIKCLFAVVEMVILQMMP